MVRKNENIQKDKSFALEEYESIERRGNINSYAYQKIDVSRSERQFRYATSAGHLFELQWDKIKEWSAFGELFTFQFAAEIKFTDLYKAYADSWNGMDPNNVHDHCINCLDYEFRKNNVSFAEVKWEKEYLYFLWKPNGPKYIKDKLHLYSIFHEFLMSLEKLNIGALTYSEKYTFIKVYRPDFLSWNEAEFQSFEIQPMHRTQKHNEASYSYIDDNGSITSCRIVSVEDAI